MLTCFSSAILQRFFGDVCQLKLGRTANPVTCLAGQIQTESRDHAACEVQNACTDIAIFPWVRNLIGFYDAAQLVAFSDFPNVQRTLDVFLQRPAVLKALEIPKRPA